MYPTETQRQQTLWSGQIRLEISVTRPEQFVLIRADRGRVTWLRAVASWWGSTAALARPLKYPSTARSEWP